MVFVYKPDNCDYNHISSNITIAVQNFLLDSKRFDKYKTKQIVTDLLLNVVLICDWLIIWFSNKYEEKKLSVNVSSYNMFFLWLVLWPSNIVVYMVPIVVANLLYSVKNAIQVKHLK